jgi:phosphoglycolate phosphatase-like HAD superfamily hydrolase
VIFDFDGTVADSFEESLLAYNRVAPRLRLRPAREAELPELRRMGAGQLMQALGIPMWKLPRLMIAVRADLHEHFHSVKPVPGIAQAIRDLHESGYHLAIVTSNSEENVWNFFNRHGIHEFDTVVAGSSIFGKATRLRRLIKAAHADLAASVYIGDTVPDIRAAREAGTLAVAVAWGFSDPSLLAAEMPDALTQSAGDLAATILALISTRQ